MNELQFIPIKSKQAVQEKNTTGYRRNITSSRLERTPDKDTVNFKEQNLKQKKGGVRYRAQGFALGVAATLAALTGGKAALDNIMPPQANFDTRGNSIAEIGEFCDIDPRAIVLANNIDEDETVDKIVLPEKMDIENDLAEVYTDGKYAYIIPNDYGISSEDLKEAFGIEDGVLKKYNDLSYNWAIDTSVEVHQGYRDYTGALIPYDGVKVPLNELGHFE